MTVHENKTLRSENVRTAPGAGTIVGAMKQFDIIENIVAGDIVRMGIIPSHHVLTDLRAEWSGAETIAKRGMPSAILHFGIISNDGLFDDDEPNIASEDQITDDLSATWKTCSASLSRLYKQLAQKNQEGNRSIGFKVGSDMKYLAGNTVTLFYAYGQI